MTSKTPSFADVSKLSLLVNLIVIMLFFWVYYLLNWTEPLLLTAISYALLARILRSTIASPHRKGVSLVKKKRFAEALRFFEESAQYFQKNEWVDRYRCITLLSSSGLSYRQKALTNMAFCHSQLGNGATALSYYEQALAENPNNEMARASLNIYQSAQPKENKQDR